MIKAIGENLITLRKLCGYTIEKIATGAGVSTTTLYKLEKGNDKNVSIWKVVDLCSFYKIDPSTVLIQGYYKNPDKLK